MKTLKFRITGTASLLMHSAKGVNPTHPLVKEKSKYTSKRKKTEDDQAIINRIDWLLGLYHDEKIGYYIPSEVIDSCLWNGAKKYKLGKLYRESALILEDAKLKFDHMEVTPEQLYDMPQYVDVRSVVIGRQRITRYRPIFHQWSFDFSINYEESIIDEDELLKIIETAGKFIGLCDYRPRFGRFIYKKLS